MIEKALYTICEEHTQPMVRAGSMVKINFVGKGTSKMQTGIEGIDKTLDGGISRTGITQILGQSGSGKSTLVHSIIKHFLETSKQRVIYITPLDEVAVLKKRVFYGLSSSETRSIVADLKHMFFGMRSFCYATSSTFTLEFLVLRLTLVDHLLKRGAQGMIAF